ncbi:MAG: hypothetical protein D3903_19050 [Candidatus Electrothrix sp. GM3_4]|nr:hypothetical protein [Candidatus Electrothrix sp. GM3_4]
MPYSLRKTSIWLSLYFGDNHDNFLADNIEATIGPTITVSFDLNVNLRTNNKQEWSYIDAEKLAQGKIKQLTKLECYDNYVLSQLKKLLDRLIKAKQAPRGNWRLIIQLNGDHEFDVIPEYRSPDTLVLRIARTE